MKRTANTMNLRAINKETIRDYLKCVETSTKTDIAQATGLSIATCGNVLKELLISSEVLEIELQASTGGRPAKRFKYNANYGQIAIMYLRKEGGLHTIYWQVTDLLGKKLREHTLEVAEMTLKEIDGAVEVILRAYPQVKVLGLGIPGIVKDGCLFLCDFDRISHTNIAARIMTKYDIAVILENDMNASALGYYKRNAYQNEDHIAYIYFPVDDAPGAGLIINNTIIRGHSNFAGELSFLPLGITREDIKSIQFNQSAFADLISKMIQSINCVINPKTIILSGYRLSDPLIGTIEEHLKSLITAIHQPEIIFEEDIHDSYVCGLLALSMNQLKCSIELVERSL